ncbi:MAG: neutral/alkaline non-lysosomal ceramidase N-terminal domain-containing protein [Candidatus Solibacter sp.]|nr:neutral/alkaline non-lysosomal ceramidase N-terminal domain-containing protein [Candidatus Solibacter sp.]
MLVGLDQSGVNDDGLNAAIARASAAIKCPVENFIVSSTHTHSSSTKGLDVAGTTFAPVAEAIVSVVQTAKSRLAPARVGYGTTQVDLNVNRDQYTAKQGWRQAANPDGPSDKTLAVVGFIGDDNVPIGVYLNYAMHPVNFYLTGVISADFPGEASRYLERFFDEHAVAVFSQGASGDQNPGFPARALGRVRSGRGPFFETVGNLPLQPQNNSQQGFNPAAAASSRQPVPPENIAAYKQAIARTGELVTMAGTLIGASAVRLMRDRMQFSDTARVWGGQEKFTCPGRERLDAANPTRENVLPGYKEGADVNLKVGLLRIGDIHFTTVNGEVYSNIATRLKAASPASKTIVVTLANGRANSGYIYSDDAFSHLSFQVIGSRLQPGCAEGRIISTALDLMRRSGD